MSKESHHANTMNRQMMELMSCSRESVDITRTHLIRIRKSIGVGSTFPKLYIDWIQLMINEGSGMFRLYALLCHTLFDEKLRADLFRGQDPNEANRFTERLQDELYIALLGRKPDGTRFSTAEIEASRYQRAAEVVCNMQDYYVNN